MNDKDIARTNDRVTNRKWKLTIGMIALYTVVFCCLFTSVSYLLIISVIPADIWQEMAQSQLAIWAYGVLGFGGWYVGMNVIQKWAPPFKGDE